MATTLDHPAVTHPDSGTCYMAHVPRWAVACWTDGTNVYAEIPTIDGGFYRYSQPYSNDGLGRLLRLLRDHKPKGPSVREPEGPSIATESRTYANSKLHQLGLI